MAIFFHHHGGRADGVVPYLHKRSPNNPPPYAFFSSKSVDSDPHEVPQASVYKFSGQVVTEADDTFWHNDLYEHMTLANAICWMRDHVSPDENEW